MNQKIKPGQVCQIRGIPSTKDGYHTNGMIVVTVANVSSRPDVWSVSPELYAPGGHYKYMGVLERYLWPLDPLVEPLTEPATEEIAA